uniref:hypothetical protein n=1 Tax=Pseudomonas aeruginosa TaxID=287 RepID=UPI002159E1DD|nr:hypothetical protein [Pseudomonas aeruginosa]UUC08615.1 TniB family NTP-binding protein [Pseudomonas aeruginosa]
MLNTRVHQSEVSMATDTPRIPEQGVATLPDDIDNLSRNQDIAVGLQVILKPRARPTPTWTSMPERTLDFEF